MMNTLKLVPTLGSSISYTTFLKDAQPNIDLHSSTEFVVDEMKQIIPQMIVPDTTIDEALIIMKRSNNRSKLYVGTSTRLLGIVDRSTLMSRNILMIANQKGLTRADLTVSDVMNSAYEMPALAKNSIGKSCIGDIKQMMQRLGEAHVQIVDENNTICGMISAADVGEALGTPMDIAITAHSFKDCFNVIHKHTELI